MKQKTKSLSAPLRVYWALVPVDQGGLGPDVAAAAAAELARLKVFFVTLRLSGPARPDAADITGALKPGVRVTVSVTGPESFPDKSVLGAVDGLDLMPGDTDSLMRMLTLAQNLDRRIPLSVSVVPSVGALEFIDGLLAVSVEAGIRIFSLPNPDLTAPGVHRASYVLDGDTRAALKRIIEARLGPLGTDVRLNVHDLFLHRELKLPGLGGRIEYAGCQAGDAIAFIDGAGLVYPCSTWPEPLGRLGVCSFGEIWSSEVRQSLRDMVNEPPEECRGCRDASDCKGGCVGMAFALGRPGGRDPGCGGARA